MYFGLRSVGSCKRSGRNNRFTLSHCVTALASIVATLAVSSMLGCGLGGNPVTSTAPGSVTPPISSKTKGGLTGIAHGGNFPITGATVQLYEAGVAGAAATGASGTTAGTPGVYGTGSSALIPTGSLTANSTSAYYPGGLPNCPIPPSGINTNSCTVLPQTDTNGNFNITGDYTCPTTTTPDTQVYVAVTGGNPGLSGTVNNTYINLIAGLGSCSKLFAGTSYTFINVNEVSTVATVWALQQFMSATFGTANTTTMGAPTSNINGLANAFSMIPNLANLPAGTAGGTNSYATTETTKINALADLLSECVNTSTPGSGGCSQITTAATAGSNVPADTVQLALNMALNPSSLVGNGSSTGTYQYLTGTGTPFMPTPSVTPTDYTIGVQLAPQTSGNNALGGGFGIAADKYGNIWISQAGNGTTPSASVVELGPSGSVLLAPVTSYTPSGTAALAADMTVAPTPASTAFTTPKAIVVDSSNNAWVGNSATLTVSTTTNSSAATNSGGDFASGAAIIKVGSIAEFTGSTAAGTAASGTVNGYYGVPDPVPAAADGSGNVFFMSTDATSGNAVSKVIMGINNSTFAYTQTSSATGTTATTGTTPTALVVDQNKTYTGGPDVFSMAIGSCVPYGNMIEAQTKLSLPLSVNNSSLSAINFGASGGTAGTYSSSTGSIECGSTIRQRFTASVQSMYGLATDSNSNIWITDSATSSYVGSGNAAGYTDPTYNALTYLQQTLSAATINTTTNGSLTTNFANLSAPKYIAVDGSNNAWVVNANTLTTGGATGTCSVASPCNSVAEFSTPSPLPLTSASTIANLSGTYGFTHTFNSPGNLTIDLSGNVWVVNTATAANYVTVIVGAASPVLPLSYAIAGSELGLKP